MRIPLADGGEGTVEALVGARGGQMVSVEVQDPLGRPIQAAMGLLGDDTIVLEMAAASGLPLLRPQERDPFKASTYGTGQLIRAALDRGARQIILGVGGSATVDGGAGALQALGVRLLDSAGRSIPPGNAGLADLARIETADLDPRLRQARIRVACDVRNPLTGPQGAAAVFGPQKGARPVDIPALDGNLGRLAEVLARDLGIAVADVPGAGAAGGLTAGLLVLGVRSEPGIDLVLEATHFAEHLAGASLILTGEGRVDGQTAQGKVISGVLVHARHAHVPVVALAGSLRGGELGPLYAAGLAAAFSIADGPIAREKAYARAASLLRHAAESVVRVWLAASRQDTR
jgi:glycerate kinase